MKEFQATPELVAEHNVGVGHMGKFEFAPAQAIFADLAKRYPDWADVKVDLAIATFNQQRPDESFASQYIVDSLAILDEVLQREPEHLRARYCKGVLLYYLGKTDEAQSHFEFVAGKDRGDAFATYFVGRCLFNAGKFDEALARYQAAIDRDPYFASAYYAAFQTLQRLRKADEAKAMMADFQKLEGNPQARKEAMKYTRMGAKAEVQVLPELGERPAAPATIRGEPLRIVGDIELPWRRSPSEFDIPANITVCDMNADGRLDIFVACAFRAEAASRNAILLSDGDAFRVAADHPLATVPDVRSALWGDYDNDGLVDVYLCRKGANQLWRQTAPNTWTEVTATTGTSGGEFDTVDGAFVDADHDGDLDLILVRANGPRALLSNNGDGTFRDIAAECGILGEQRPGRQVLVTDLDGDRDADLVFLNQQPPHDVYLNDRLWTYHTAPGLEDFRAVPADAVLAFDLTSEEETLDGRVELITARANRTHFWLRTSEGSWIDIGATRFSSPPDNTSRLVAADMNLDANTEIWWNNSVAWCDVQTDDFLETVDLTSSSLVTLDGVRPALIALTAGDAPALWRWQADGNGAVGLAFSGKEEKQDEMRSNRSGIGVKVNARICSQWFSAETFRNDSGPGQSLMPLTFGAGGADKVDFVMLHWSDGVFQTETNLEAGKLHKIEETQRQTSSCPLVFVWDGQQFAFVTDLLGVGGIGFNLGRGEYAPSDSTENLLLPEGLLAPRDGRYVLKLHEPMEEAAYLDHAQLAVYDLPPGWRMALDERFGASDPQPTGEAIFYREEWLPSRAINDRTEDVTDRITTVDNDAAPPGERDPRFIGRTERSSLVLEFNQALDEHADLPVLIADGWVEYPYSQTMFAAWQAGAKYEAPTLEARDAQGAWHVVHAEFGYPAGMPRRMALPLANLPVGASALRITTTYEIYWDRLAVAFAEACPDVRRTVVSADVATLSRTGFPLRSNGPQRRPYYDYAQRAPFDDMRHQAGWYTEFGDVRELTKSADDALTVFGPGEEVHLEFAAPEPPSPGWRRRLVLETVGWCKDMDLFTATGDTVEPLPHRHEVSAETARLHERTRTRYESGR